MEEGSQITKEVADIVLLKNKFSLLPKIFDEGNKIINTVNSIAKLFLTKNFIIIYSTLLSLLFLLEFPFTPRRVALINLFAIGLPSLIIAMKNTDISKTRNFMKDLFSFVTLSALIVTGAGYAGQYVMSNLSGSSYGTELHMAMVSIMIFVTTANFYAVIMKRNDKNTMIYIIYAVSLIGLYVFLSLTKIDFVILNFIKKFYEITYLAPQYWRIVALISIVSSGLLVVLQYVRSILIRKV
jgi:cation-transporting P-type ATPase E